MNSFFKTFWAALLAFVVANILIVVLTILIFAGFAASLTPVTEVDDDSVLSINFSEAVSDNPTSNPMNDIDFMSMKMKGNFALLDVLNAIEKAADDDNIKGIYMDLTHSAPMGMATVEEIRAALVKFKESGKFIISYADYYSQGTYYLCSVADKVYVNPEGGLSWQGLASTVMFMKGALDKLDVKPEIIRCGKFKAAVEPFILDKMSPENSLQMNTLLSTIWGNMLKNISVSRGLDSAKLQQYATDLSVIDPKDAVAARMIDSALYVNDVDSMLCKMTDQDDEPNFISLRKYINAPKKKETKVIKNKVAVVYAEGNIVTGKSDNGTVGSETLLELLSKVRKDDKVKAVVFRVNSPGGSALASEVMWREVELIRKVKPVVVSMGNYAASGGYYIAAPADVILANPATLTGSIGVFSVFMDAQKGLKDKLGLTFDVAKTNPSADLGAALLGVAGVRSITPTERAIIQKQTDKVYSTFVGHVAQGRNMSVEKVDSIGGGRVWSGVSAKGLGLIDGFGGLKDAIALAADRAGISNEFKVYVPAVEESPFAQMMKAISQSAQAEFTPSVVGSLMSSYDRMVRILSTEGVQATMPYTIEIQ